MTMTATYSPEDNKLRLYSTARLDAETFARVKAAGFAWAPKQQLFVAPCWTPQREDLLVELCGEIDDEDKSLVERAEERAERFEQYESARTADAEAARTAAEKIMSFIPMGQPILVGHHSERRARKDAERIENGIRKAVNLWKTAKYWAQRATGALRSAKYKELPGVRARRLKKLESELRSCESRKAEAEKRAERWSRDDVAAIVLLSGETFDEYCRKKGETPEQVKAKVLAECSSSIAHNDRWIEHLRLRVGYEKAMQQEAGGLVTDRAELEVGGRVKVGDEWFVIAKINRKGGEVVSVSTVARYRRVRLVAEILDYQPPTNEDVAKIKAATKLPPLCNYPGEGIVEITQAQWDSKHGDYKGTRVVDATAEYGTHRVRCGFFGGLSIRFGSSVVFITDAKRKDPPPPSRKNETTEEPEPVEEPVEEPSEPAPVDVQFEPGSSLPVAADPSSFGAMEDILKRGIKVVSAPQLFPTPALLAELIVERAQVEASELEILEPSAGTGNLILPILNRNPFAKITAVEVHSGVAEVLRSRFGRGNFNVDIFVYDFLSCDFKGKTFDRIVMNPPFGGGADIAHVNRAIGLLAPGGILVAIVANGPRQQAKLKPAASEWQDLPDASFAEAGTMVRTAMFVYRKEI